MVILQVKKRSFLVGIISLIIICSFLANISLVNKNVECTKNDNVITSLFTTNWWDVDWQYCNKVEVDNIGGLLNNYSVKVEIPFYFDYGNASDTGSDIRFTNQDNSTLLNHWIEEWDNKSNHLQPKQFSFIMVIH